MILDKEKFDSVKELAEIQVKIAEGRASLSQIKLETGKYLAEREKEVQEKITGVLKESREALGEISKNYDQLVSYKKELEAYAIEIKGFANTLATLFEDFNLKIKEAHGAMAEHYQKLNQIKKELKIAQVNVDEDRKQLARDRDSLNKDARAFKDKREALDRAWQELERKKN